MLNILFLNSIREGVWGGGEKWMVAVAKGLKARRHRVVIAGRRGSRFLKGASTEGLKVYSLRIRGDFGPINIYRLALLMRKGKVQLLCVNFDKDLRLGGLGAKLAGVRALVVRKGLPLMRDKLRFKLSYRFLADKIVCPSNSIKRELGRYSWLDRNLIEVIPNGVDLDYFHPGDSQAEARVQFGLPSNGLVVGIVGRLTHQKGHKLFLQAAKLLAKSFPQVVFWVVGDGERKGELEDIAKELGIRERVIFSGYRTNLPLVYAALDILVLPSLFEGLPNVVLEAMACGKPVVATRVGGVPEAVEDGVSGLIVSPNNHSQLAQSIKKLLYDRLLRETLGKASRRRIERSFSSSLMVERVEKSFSSLLKDKKGVIPGP